MVKEKNKKQNKLRFSQTERSKPVIDKFNKVFYILTWNIKAFKLLVCLRSIKGV